MSRSLKFKQIVVDIRNYQVLKEMGKAGDSFNDVIGNIISKLNSGGVKDHQN